MSDLQSTLDAIDRLAVHECGSCRKRLAEDGPSPYFCDEFCQDIWALRQRPIVAPAPEPPSPPTSRPLDIHIIQRPRCTCTMCSHPAVWPHPAAADTITVRVEPNLSEFIRALGRFNKSMALAASGIWTTLQNRPPEQYRRELERATPRRYDGLTNHAIELLYEYLGAPAVDTPTDPAVETVQERALRLRRTRNTGPQPHTRAPRRIDARRTR